MDNRVQLAAELIASWEGLRLKSYSDSGGVWTIGFGHTVCVKEGDVCTAAQASEWLATDAEPLFALVSSEKLVSAAAYISFGYNSGRTSLEHVLAGKANLSEFIHDRHGNVLEDLVLRRAAEQGLIDSVMVISGQSAPRPAIQAST